MHKNIKTIQPLSLCCAPYMVKVDYLKELQGNLSTDALELCIDAEPISSPTAQVPSLESSMSTYDSMMQTLNDELNDGVGANHVHDPDLMDFEDADFFNMDCATAMLVDYEMNYNMKQLKHIAGYYGIKCKSRKGDVIQDIVAYETDSANHEIVGRRKRLFHYMNALKNDEYFKTLILL